MRARALIRAKDFPGSPALLRPAAGQEQAHRLATTRYVANRLVGILRACIERGTLYDELVAWPKESEIAD